VGAVAWACHSKLHRKLRSAGLCFEASVGKRKFVSKKQLSMVVYAIIPAMAGSKNRRSRLAWAKSKSLSPK
jgi:hypothetical protein